MSALLGFVYLTRDGLRRRPGLLFFLLALVAAAGIGFALDRALFRIGSPEARAARWARRGNFEMAREVIDAAVSSGPTVPLVLEYVDLHAGETLLERLRSEPKLGLPSPIPTGSVPHGAPGTPRPDPDAPDSSPDAGGGDIEALVSAARLLATHPLPLPLFDRPDLDPDVRRLGEYWKGVRFGDISAAAQHEVEAIADEAPPRPYYNHVLALVAEQEGDAAGAAKRFLREGKGGSTVAEEDIARGLAILLATDEPALDKALEEPAVKRFAPAGFRFEVAVRRHDVKEALRTVIPASYPKPPLAPLLVSIVAALGWGVFLGRFAATPERPLFRGALFTAALVLGGLSIVPTDVSVQLEEQFLKLRETGDPVKDALFFVCGVGFREELAKVLLFLPLVPFLRRKAGALRDPKKPVPTLLDGTTAGAFVGLGFATIENLLYLEHGDLSTGMARFLTANFLHLSTTGIVAPAVLRVVDDGERHVGDLSRTFLFVVVMHGAYDFLLSGGLGSGGSFFAMTVFILLGRRFVATLAASRTRAPKGPPALATFHRSLAWVVGASVVYAFVEVGPANGAKAIGAGLLGIAILVWVFTYELRDV